MAIAGAFVGRNRGVGVGKAIPGFVLGVASLVIFVAVTMATVAAVDGAVKGFDKQVKAQTDTSAATDASDARELKDAKLGKPQRTPLDGLSVDVTLTNNSSKTSDYSGTVVFESPDGRTQYGDGMLFVENLNRDSPRPLRS